MGCGAPDVLGRSPAPEVQYNLQPPALTYDARARCDNCEASLLDQVMKRRQTAGDRCQNAVRFALLWAPLQRLPHAMVDDIQTALRLSEGGTTTFLRESSGKAVTFLLTRYGS